MSVMGDIFAAIPAGGRTKLMLNCDRVAYVLRAVWFMFTARAPSACRPCPNLGLMVP